MRNLGDTEEIDLWSSCSLWPSQFLVPDPCRDQWHSIPLGSIRHVCVLQIHPPTSPPFLSFLILIIIYLLAVPELSCGILDLVPQSGIEPEPTVLGAQSLHHWTTRHVPLHLLFLLLKFIWSGLLLPSKDLTNTWTAMIQNCWKMLSKFAKFLRILNLGKQPNYRKSKGNFMARKPLLDFPQLAVVGGSEVKLSQGTSLGEKPWAVRNIKQNKTL